MKNELPEKRFYLSKENISNLPDESGIYFLYQTGNILVYIGKAMSLKKELFSMIKKKNSAELVTKLFTIQGQEN